jgi:peptidoglycan/xylan/chitin deacetylase (PgdA/CDA1 family)
VFILDEKRYVVLSFDVDGETLWVARDQENWNRPLTLSQGKYGPKVGLPRILNLLDKYNIPATFFVPGWIIENYKDEIKEVVARGHELGHHGYLHEWPDLMDPDKEREVMELGIDRILGISQKKPAGYRSPAWEFSSKTMEYLKEYGFLYSSNYMDNDEPYIHPNGLVELPVQWYLDDAPFFLYALRLPGRTIHPPSNVLETWMEEFSALYEEKKPLVLTLHPQIIGRAYRTKLLEKFIQFVRQHPNTEFVTAEKLAQITLQKNS